MFVSPGKLIGSDNFPLQIKININTKRFEETIKEDENTKAKETISTSLPINRIPG